MKPEVSVLLSAYNAERYIDKSIESVLAQTFKNFELLIVDDGSTDRTWEIITSFRDDRIKCFQIKNSGVAWAKNFLLKQAIGDWIAIIDADDIWHPLKLEIQLLYLKKHPECKLFGTFAQIINDQGNKLYIEPKVTDWPTIQRVLPFKNVFTHSSVIFDASVVGRIGGYPVSIQREYAEDYQMIKNFVKYGQAENLPVALVEYRIARQSVTSSMKHNKINASQKFREAKHFYLMARIHAFYLNDTANARKHLLHSLKYNAGMWNSYLLLGLLLMPWLLSFVRKRILHTEHFDYLRQLKSPEEFLEELKKSEN